MINKKMTTCVAAVALVTNSAFAAQPGSTYGGIQFATFKYTEDGIDPEYNPTGLIGRFGKNINESFSIEGRLGIGLSDDTNQIFGIDATLELDTLIGVYGLGHVMVNESSSVYGLIGFTQAEATVSAPGFISSSDDESGLSLGIGADIGTGNNVAFNIEFIQYLSKSDFDLNAISLGVKFGF